MKTADRVLLLGGASQLTVIAMICASVLGPAIVVSPSLPYVKTEQLIVPLVVFGYLWLLLAGIARPIRWNAMFAIGFLYCAGNAFSMWYGAAVLGHPVILSDFYDLPKVWLPVAFFTIGYEAELDESALRRLFAWFSAAIFLVCFYAVGQFWGLGFTYRLNPYYSPGGHIDAALQYAHRVYATAGNANVLGELMTFSIPLFLLAALFRVGSLLRNLAVLLACLVTLVMTGSRFGLGNLAIGFVLLLVLLGSYARRHLARLSLLLLLVPLIVGVYQIVASSNLRTLERYQTLREPLQIDSFRQRVDDLWLEAWSDFKRSPLVGHGPGKGFFFWGDRFIDCEYLSVLRESGSIGFLVFLSYYFYPLLLIRRGQRLVEASGAVQERFPAHLIAVHSTFIMGTLALVMNLGMSTFYMPFLQSFLWLWLGVGAGSAARLAALAPDGRPAYHAQAVLEPLRA